MLQVLQVCKVFKTFPYGRYKNLMRESFSKYLQTCNNLKPSKNFKKLPRDKVDRV